MKKKDRDRKRKEKRRKARPHGGDARKTNKGAAICGMMKAAKPKHPTTRNIFLCACAWLRFAAKYT